MQKSNINLGTIALFFTLLTFFSCQKEEISDNEIPVAVVIEEPTPEILSDEDVGEYETCTDKGNNATRATDISNPVNVGAIDDRSCYANYKESFIYRTCIKCVSCYRYRKLH